MIERLSATATARHTLTAEAYADLALDTARWKPLVVLSCPVGTTPRVPVEQLREAVGAAAQVEIVSAHQAWEIQRQLPDAFWVYGGAARIILPDATATDHPDRHPLFLTYEHDEPEQTIARIRDWLTSHGHRGTPAVAGDVDEPGTDREAGTETGRLIRLRDAHRELTRTKRANMTLSERVGELEARNAEQQGQLERARTSISQLEADVDELTVPPAPVFADPGEQLRHEIWLRWLHNTPEPERGRYPLRDYHFGPDFLDSVGLPLVSRDRLLDVVVDVITRRVYEIPARRTHPLRVADAGGTPQRERSDGAFAWRCDLKTCAHGGARLAFWERSDGTVELGKAGHHDDYALR